MAAVMVQHLEGESWSPSMQAASRAATQLEGIASACHASSRIRFALHSRCCPLIWQVFLLSAAFAPEIFGFSSKFLRVVVLFHFEKAELALEGIRQFFVADEIEEMKLDTFCDLHETLRLGSSGFPVCWPLFGMRVRARCLGMDAQKTIESWSESNLAKETGVCERTQVDGRIRKVQAGVLVLLLRQRGRLRAPREEAFVFSISFTRSHHHHQGSNGPSTRVLWVMLITSFGSHVSSRVCASFAVLG